MTSTPDIVQDASDWTAATFGSDIPAEQIDDGEASELEAICAGLEARGLAWNHTDRAHFPFHRLAPRLQAAARQLHHGRGFVLLRGLPFDRWPTDRSRLGAWGLGTWIGTHVSQTVQGVRLVDVTDVSGREPSPRQYRTSQELRLHTDPASDLIGLACVRDAKRGGDSVLTSARAVHEAMRKLRPDLLRLLHEGFHWHRFGEGRPEDGPYSRDRVPVFAIEKGRVNCRYVRSPIAAGHKDAGIPLTDAQIEALDLFDRLASSPELRIVFRMRPGDLLLVNNLAVLHARTQFEDHPEPDRRRHMIRLWLEAPGDGHRAPAVLNFFNAGRCGIAPQAGQAAAYDVAALYRDRASGGVAQLGVQSSAP